MAVRRNVLYMVGGLVILVGIAFFAGRALPQGKDNGPLKIGVVDTQKVFEQYTETKAANERLAGDVKKAETQAKSLDEEIKKLEENYAKQRIFIEDQQKLAEMEGNIRRKRQELDTFLRRSQQALDERRDELAEPILKKIREAIQEIAAAEGYTLVLEKQLIALYHLPEMDLTERMTKALNERAAKETPEATSPSSQTPSTEKSTPSEKPGTEEKPKDSAKNGQ